MDTAETLELFRADYPDVRDLGDRVLASFKDYGDARLALEAAGLRE